MRKLKRRMNFLMDFQIVVALMKRRMIHLLVEDLMISRDEINLFILLGGMRVGINIMIRRISGYGVFGPNLGLATKKFLLCFPLFSSLLFSFFFQVVLSLWVLCL